MDRRNPLTVRYKKEQFGATAVETPISDQEFFTRRDGTYIRFPINRSNSSRNVAAHSSQTLFHKCSTELTIRHVDYRTKHFQPQNRFLNAQSEAKVAKHTHFNYVSNASANTVQPHTENVKINGLNNKLSSCKGDTYLSESVTLKSKYKTNGTPAPNQSRAIEHLPPVILENPTLMKYWKKRFTLFSKFDMGIQLDLESWYSVTPEDLAIKTAEWCKCGTILDGFCGAGGNAIQFAKTCRKVIAIDIDPKKIKMAQNNARVYGVADKIQFIVGDFFKLADILKADVVFLSPPWGGPTYAHLPIYDLEEMLQPVPFSKLLIAARKISLNVAAFLPRNSNTRTLINEAATSRGVKIEKEYSRNKFIGVTAYYNDLALG